MDQLFLRRDATSWTCISLSLLIPERRSHLQVGDQSELDPLMEIFMG